MASMIRCLLGPRRAGQRPPGLGDVLSRSLGLDHYSTQVQILHPKRREKEKKCPGYRPYANGQENADTFPTPSAYVLSGSPHAASSYPFDSASRASAPARHPPMLIPISSSASCLQTTSTPSTATMKVCQWARTQAHDFKAQKVVRKIS